MSNISEFAKDLAVHYSESVYAKSGCKIDTISVKESLKDDTLNVFVCVTPKVSVENINIKLEV